MIRGAQKKMIVLRTHNSRMFEEAYFVMRHDVDAHPNGKNDNSDILHEANRILEGSLAGCMAERSAKERRKRQIICLFCFLGGLLLGGGGMGLLWCLLG